MGLLSRLAQALGWPSSDELSGARLSDPEPWAVPATRDAARFLRALPVLFPSGAVLYFEGTTEPSFAGWLAARAMPTAFKIAPGTIWPRPDSYHVPLDAAVVSEAADRVDREGIPLPAIHLHVHDGTRVLLEWHDAFCDEPMYIHRTVPLERIEAFGHMIGAAPGQITRQVNSREHR